MSDGREVIEVRYYEPPPRRTPTPYERAVYALAQGLGALARGDGPTAEREIAEALEYARRVAPR